MLGKSCSHNRRSLGVRLNEAMPQSSISVKMDTPPSSVARVSKNVRFVWKLLSRGKKRSMTKRLLSSKTIAVALERLVHLLPGGKRQGSLHLMGNALKALTHLFRGATSEFWILLLYLLPQCVVQDG